MCGKNKFEETIYRQRIQKQSVSLILYLQFFIFGSCEFVRLYTVDSR